MCPAHSVWYLHTHGPLVVYSHREVTITPFSIFHIHSLDAKRWPSLTHIMYLPLAPWSKLENICILQALLCANQCVMCESDTLMGDMGQVSPGVPQQFCINQGVILCDRNRCYLVSPSCVVCQSVCDIGVILCDREQILCSVPQLLPGERGHLQAQTGFQPLPEWGLHTRGQRACGLCECLFCLHLSLPLWLYAQICWSMTVVCVNICCQILSCLFHCWPTCTYTNCSWKHNRRNVLDSYAWKVRTSSKHGSTTTVYILPLFPLTLPVPYVCADCADAQRGLHRHLPGVWDQWASQGGVCVLPVWRAAAERDPQRAVRDLSQDHLQHLCQHLWQGLWWVSHCMSSMDDTSYIHSAFFLG